MDKKIKAVFLCTRLSDHFWGALGHLVTHYPVEVDIVRYPPDELAPYEFEEGGYRRLHDYEKVRDRSIHQFLRDIDPDAIYVAGWSDNLYNKAVKKYKERIPVILGLDNPWRNTTRQRAGVVLAGASLRSLFSHLWVPGMPQFTFANRLGFNDNQILRNLLVANERRLEGLDLDKNKYDSDKKKLIFLGRYVEYKRPDWLVEVFRELEAEFITGDWRLKMYGEGPMKEKLIAMAQSSRGIEINSFVSPQNLAAVLRSAHAFCLPSFNEHWGVVIHEAAYAGLPMVVSDTCGAAGDLLIHNYNGYKYRSNEKVDLKRSLIKLFQSTNEELFRMAQGSKELSTMFTHEKWSANFMSIFK